MIENTLKNATKVDDMVLAVKPKTHRKFSSYLIKDITTDDVQKTSIIAKFFSSLFRIIGKREYVVALFIALGAILTTLGVMLAFSVAIGFIVGGSELLVIGVLLGLPSKE